MVEPGGPQMTKGRMRFACWATETTATDSECVILIAFTRQRCLRERS